MTSNFHEDLDRAWDVRQPAYTLSMKIALLQERIVNPLVMAVLFFVVLTPIAWLRRRFVDDPLGLKRLPQSDSYWITRNPPGPHPETMAKQF